MTKTLLDKIEEARQSIHDRLEYAPEIAVILGTGLGKFTSEIENQIEIPYADIPYFPEPTVEFHSGKLICGDVEGKKVIAFSGRFHFYEGYSMEQVTFPVRVAKALGVQALLLSNAAGAMNLNWKKGDLMLITDHINLLPDNPLRGENHEELGPRFPDMSQPYDAGINKALTEAAGKANVDLRQGVYVSVMGPNLETAAEYRFLRNVGADAVGMSTVPEVIVANHGGLPCAAVSVLTDECDPDNLAAVDISEIIAIAGKAELKMIQIFKGAIRSL